MTNGHFDIRFTWGGGGEGGPVVSTPHSGLFTHLNLIKLFIAQSRYLII